MPWVRIQAAMWRKAVNRNGRNVIEFWQKNYQLIGKKKFLEERYIFVTESRNAKSLIYFIVYIQRL